MPPTQLVHELAPDAGLIVPGAHGVGAVEPVAQDDPASHAVHSEASVRPWVLENVPAKQGSSADAPGGQNLPIAPTPTHVKISRQSNCSAQIIAILCQTSRVSRASQPHVTSPQ